MIDSKAGIFTKGLVSVNQAVFYRMHKGILCVVFLPTALVSYFCSESNGLRAVSGGSVRHNNRHHRVTLRPRPDP